ncbi:MAG: acyl-CoA thioesterase [Gammaproteobacteria bacterium]
MPKHPYPHRPSFVELLDLEEIDRDLFRGMNEFPNRERTTLYGGQVAAQALKAAGMTVSEGRHPHSLHGYFLRAGRRELPVIFKVDRDRDGNSFSARRVSAVQEGEVIFDMTASFHIDRTGLEYTVPIRQVDIAPEDCIEEAYANSFPAAEAHPVPPLRVTPFGEKISPIIWCRVRERLPDDRLTHCCALTYLSDISSGFAGPDIPDIPPGGSSLDHAMWFRGPIRADGWCLLDMTPMMAGGSRGLYKGAMHAREGTLGAMLTQEVLFRNRDAPVPPAAPG